MGIKFSSSQKYDILGRYQQQILDAISKALPGAAADYAPVPFGKVALIVTWPEFGSRDESARKTLVETAILASLRINPDDYLAGIHCWTPREAELIKKQATDTP